jgi:hypothetical protein
LGKFRAVVTCARWMSYVPDTNTARRDQVRARR